MSVGTQKCIICAGDVESVPTELETFPFVTSDCRPWFGVKRIGRCKQCGILQRTFGEAQQNDIARIYENYSMFGHAKSLTDQKIFSEQGAAGRTETVLRHVQRWLPQTTRAVLDVGCGRGAGLQALSNLFPQAELVGLEPYDHQAAALSDQIPNLKAVFRDWGDLGSHRYDLITLFHVFEHLPNPIDALRILRGLLNENGILLIQVPYYKTNPFDFLISDHMAHYRAHDLGSVLQQAGFSVLEIGNGALAKELTAVASVSSAIQDRSAIPDDENIIEAVPLSLNWLVDVAKDFRAFADDHQKVAVYGCGPVGCWLAALAFQHVAFFVDDDPDRIGGTFLGLPVVSVNDLSCEIPIYLGFLPNVAEKIARRAGVGRHTLRAPPSWH